MLSYVITIDLDDTLYPGSIGIRECVKKNIEIFLVEKCGFSESKAATLRVELFKTYGSTLAGLRAHGYDVTHQDYHAFVHGSLPYQQLIKPDTNLRNLLSTITQRKIIFTNSDRDHAVRVLDCLGIKQCFDQIICFETMNPNISNNFPVLLKPSLHAFKLALHAANVLDPRRTLFLDDSPANIAAAKQTGLQTVVVGMTVKCNGADYAIENVHQIPQIWTTDDDGDQSSRITRSKSDLDALPITTATVGA
ncbi:unnamed protein product [Lupinus luteus]|uniref:Uncharacterized protein n=1 Tax=Lupinus luteus TaxID=3873 RepID=A0AAV1XFB9_LUPLU